MSTRITRSSSRNETITTKTSSAANASKSAVSERRRQRKQPNEVRSDVKHLNGKKHINEHNSGDNDDDDIEDDVHVTPPKQRKPCEKANALSPSTLLHRLSIGDDDNDDDEHQTKNVKPKSKIDNARKVLNAAETEELYGREREIAELNEFLSSNASKKTSASIYISGQPGKSHFVF